MITPKQIYDATNGGLDILKYYYPQAEPKKLFKVRDESTASASLKLFGDVWKVTDFGDDGHAKNAIDVCMAEEKLTFAKAIYTLASRYGVMDESIQETNRPEIRRRDATEEEKEGEFRFEIKEFTDFELKVWGPRVKPQLLAEYRYKSLSWYSRTKRDVATGELKTTITRSTDTYPIFMRDCGTFKKIYQPLNYDKAYRFFYVGDKPKDYINGFDELQKAVTEYMSDREDEFMEEGSSSSSNKSKKYPAAVICSGERDAICCAAFGYKPLWFNSETASFSEYDYGKISRMVEVVYNIPDLDLTGIRKAKELAFQYLEIRTVWLPKWLSSFKDARGKSRKDLRDYLELNSDLLSFNRLMDNAMPMQFWNRVVTKDAVRDEINSEYLLHFLKHSGFGVIESKNEKTGKQYVRVIDNVVYESSVPAMRVYLKEFLDERHFPIAIKNLVNNSSRINASLFEMIGQYELDFANFTPESQFFQFKNATVEVRADDVRFIRSKFSHKYVMSNDVFPIDFKRLPSGFCIQEKMNAENAIEFDIDVKHKESKLFCYLIQTSRIHWREELENRLDLLPVEAQTQYRMDHKFSISGKLLTEEEILEQKRHLINKIFTIGYLLHSYKKEDKAWCVIAMDYLISENSEANGRTGKSFLFNALRKIKNSVPLNGKNNKITDNPHIFDRVSDRTDLVILDDAIEHLNFNFFYNVITGDWEVNPKFNQSYSIPFSLSPKLCISTNYAMRKIDSSTQARLLYMLFSDYYHEIGGTYKETRKISDDFGMVLMNSKYSEVDWNRDINFMIDCLQFYLSTVFKNIKLNPPMNRADERNILSMIGEQFYDWATIYLSPESANLDTMLPKQKMYEDYLGSINSKYGCTINEFKKKLKYYCKLNNYIFNPQELCNDKGRIIKKTDMGASEFVYIQSTQDITQEEVIKSKINETNASLGNDQPF